MTMPGPYFDLLLADVHLATMRDARGYCELRDAAVGIAGARIAWMGAARDLPRDADVGRRIS
jgi:imidazolonepropionase